MKFKNKVVVVTGSSSGIGKATAIQFARAGANVVVNSRSNVTGGEQVVESIKDLGVEAVYVQADLADPAHVARLFRATVEQFGTVDILINNAGNTIVEPFLETTVAHWEQVFHDNLYSSVFCAQEAARIMQQNGGGKIINTSSIRGIIHAGIDVAIAYSAAKAALISFTKTLAKELAPAINVNAVAPGFVQTENYARMKPEVKEKMIQSTLIKRLISVDEIAEAFLYLAGADAVTGEVLLVDGGFTLKAN